MKGFRSALLAMALLVMASFYPGHWGVSDEGPQGLFQAYAFSGPFEVDQSTHTVTVSPGTNATAHINSALSFLVNRPDKSTPWTLKFKGGQYQIDRTLMADKLENVSLVSDRSSPAVLRKAPGFSSEYLFYARFSKNVSISGFQFYGLTKTYNASAYDNSSHPVWRDQGIYFGSSSDMSLTYNRFHDFGNAALRITTSESDPKSGVNSFNAYVARNSFFNVFQVTTTSNSHIHGGTANYVFELNNIWDLRGSIKFASRMPGARNVKILNNTIYNSSRDGFEIVSYSDAEMVSNKIFNTEKFAINSYTNSDRALEEFNWGENMIFRFNQIQNSKGGFRMSFNPYSSGYKVAGKNVIIEGNIFDHVYNPEKNPNSQAPASYVINGPIHGLVMQRNRYTNNGGVHIRVPRTCSGLMIQNNIVDNVAYVNTYQLE